MELNFYKLPFKDLPKCGWIYDSEDDFAFQFELGIDPKIHDEVLAFINGYIKSTKNRFRKHPEDPIVIQIQSDKEDWFDFIVIRGWGNLTGTGAHNFSEEKAIKIQDDLVKWLLYKLNKNNND